MINPQHISKILNDMEIKPKPTKYNGHIFRSKLEAKWAVFFDLLRVPYVYEPEAFICSDGSQYTPDFYLPRGYLRKQPGGLYLEIKPFGWQKDVHYISRIASAFVDTVSFVLFCGEPFDVWSEVNSDSNEQLSPQWDCGMTFCYCRPCLSFKADHYNRHYQYCPVCLNPSSDVKVETMTARQYSFKYHEGLSM